ncbi:DUF4381 domain-containing protein [Legionella fairfieldensis]|uniref:DUF4381 domain-containing protein n=1 Tax=Legionella fairfieldensis TaxID=45064 RepID=UPI0004900E7B|nr:DUF4381 domain-containing protein [Legionella fairfieldensis]
MSESEILTKLHDIHLPSPVSWWPLAPGWYLVLFLSLVGLVYLIYICRRTYNNSLAKRQALKLLASLERAYRSGGNSQIISMQVSELLRRVALVYFARAEVAGLQGEDWLKFLKHTSKNIDTNELRFFLLELPYQPTHKVDLQPLFNGAKTWIKQRRAPCSN